MLSIFFLFAVFYPSSIIVSCRPSFFPYFTPLSLDLLPVLAQSSLILHNIASQPIKQRVQILLQNRWAQLFLWPLPTSWPPATQSLSQDVSWQTTAALHCIPASPGARQTMPAGPDTVCLCVFRCICVCGVVRLFQNTCVRFGTASFSTRPPSEFKLPASHEIKL